VDNYDFGEDDIEVVEDAVQPVPGPEFAAPRPAPAMAAHEYQDAVDTLAEGIKDDAVQTQVEGLLKPVLELVNNASTFEDVERGLDGMYGKMDESDVAETVEKTVLLGEVWGRLSNKGGEQ